MGRDHLCMTVTMKLVEFLTLSAAFCDGYVCSVIFFSNIAIPLSGPWFSLIEEMPFSVNLRAETRDRRVMTFTISFVYMPC